MKKKLLGVNIDHIATLREARKEIYPNPKDAIEILKKCKVDQVTVHLREDRRHIQDRDVKNIIALKKIPVNLELAVSQSIIRFALQQHPQTCTFVPEKREEITTEGGLDCVKHKVALQDATVRLHKKNIQVSLFIEPSLKQIKTAHQIGANAIEIHTGKYCRLMERFFYKNQHYRYKNSSSLSLQIQKEIDKIQKASEFADKLGLKVCAGHGLHVDNLKPIVKISQIVEYNIGHAIIARSIFVGLEKAIQEIQKVLL